MRQSDFDSGRAQPATAPGSRHRFVFFINSGSIQRTLTLILKLEVSVRLIALSSLVMNQLHHCMKQFFFQFQNNLVLTSKDREVSRIDTSPFGIKVSISLLYNFPLTLLFNRTHLLWSWSLSDYESSKGFKIAEVITRWLCRLTGLLTTKKIHGK